MSSKLFLDSSILVEWAKKTQTSLFDHLANSDKYELCINHTILSEFTYYWLAIGGGKAPVTLKRDGAIPSVLKLYNPISLLKKVTWLTTDQAIIPLYLKLMEDYNLLPNDALILATCKLNSVNQLASYDADFEAACIGEGIQLIRQVSDLA
ncbi:type II toxin-antitoxin system VapC family toxin [Spirosoma agri]|uniref:PIN domain-containing protein n=1 Tax=Spirosoma agri TaxID=1987381 RepID=A0A6M0IC49_9BACT|nr:type II toxin-antitoxin system VapC family toxin [Spirosoma agri]NEU65810.1 PIN domain-containing protein [Spirosoma agri]